MYTIASDVIIFNLLSANWLL